MRPSSPPSTPLRVREDRLPRRAGRPRRSERSDFDIAGFLNVLEPYYKGGEYDYLLNARQNPDLLQKRFIVFEIDAVKDHPILFPVVTIIIMELFISKMRRLQGQRKMLVIEEAWKALMKTGMADFVQYTYRTCRKFFGEAVVVTQELDDLTSPIIKNTILNNSDCKILLDMRKYVNRFDQCSPCSVSRTRPATRYFP